MTSRQEQKITSYLTLSLTCREHIAIISLIPAMMRNVKEFDLLLQEILKTVEEQAMPVTQHAKQKNMVRREMALIVSKFAAIIRSYCHEANDLITLAKFQHTYSELCRKKQDIFYGICTFTINFLSENFESFRDFGMKKSDVERLKQLHEMFKNIWSLPRNAHIQRSVKTIRLAELIKKIDFLLKEQMDTLLLSFFQFPEFCNAFKAARKQIKYGRPKEVLKNKIKKYRAAPALPRTRKSSKPIMQLKPLVMPEIILAEQQNNL